MQKSQLVLDGARCYKILKFIWKNKYLRGANKREVNWGYKEGNKEGKLALSDIETTRIKAHL